MKLELTLTVFILSNVLLVSSAVLADEPPKFIELSHKLNNNTLHWPTAEPFVHTISVNGTHKNSTGQDVFLMSDKISMGVHCGTHLDAPIHFNENGLSVEKIPLDRLIGVPVYVVDVSPKVALDRAYVIQVADLVDAFNMSIARANSVLLAYTGISQDYEKGQVAYFGTNSTESKDVRQPGFSAEAAQFLVNEGIYGVGLDALSADNPHKIKGNGSMDAAAHTIFNGANIYILENVNKELAKLVGQNGNYKVTIAPLPIQNGSGSPIRLVAVKKETCLNGPSNSALMLNPSSSFSLGMALPITLMALYTLIQNRE